MKESDYKVSKLSDAVKLLELDIRLKFIRGDNDKYAVTTSAQVVSKYWPKDRDKNIVKFYIYDEDISKYLTLVSEWKEDVTKLILNAGGVFDYGLDVIRSDCVPDIWKDSTLKYKRVAIDASSHDLIVVDTSI